MGPGKSRSEEVRERRQRGLQTLAFVGALVVLGVVLYSAAVTQRNRRTEDRMAATAMAQQRASATAAAWDNTVAQGTATAQVRASATAAVQATAAARRTATAQVLLPFRSTPVPMPGEAISAENAGRVQQLARWGKGEITTAAWSPDGQFLAVGTTAGVYLQRWDPWKEVRYLEARSRVWGIAFSPDGQTLAAALFDGSVAVWRTTDGALLRTVEGPISPYVQVALSPEGNLLVAGVDVQNQRKVQLWRDGKEVVLQAPAGGPEYAASAVALSRDGRLLAAGRDDGQVHLWQTADGTLAGTLSVGEAASVTCLAFSPEGNVLAAASSEGGVNLWQAREGTLLRTLRHTGTVDRMAVSAGGQLLVVDGSGVVQAWDVPGEAVLKSWWDAGLWETALSPDGRLLALRDQADGKVRLWRVTDRTPLHTLEGYGAGVAKVAFSPDGQILVANGYDGTAWVWQVGGGKPIQALSPPGYGYPGGLGLAFSPDGQTLALGGAENRVLLWHVADWKLTRTLVRARSISATFYTTSPACSVAYSSDGQIVAAGLEGQALALWRVADGALLRVLGEGLPAVPQKLLIWRLELLATAPELRLGIASFALLRLPPYPEWCSVAFSPDGEVLAAGSWGGTVHVWRVVDGALLRTLGGEMGWASGIAFSPDGEVLAVALSDGTVRLWRTTDWTPLHTLEGDRQFAARDVAFSPDGLLLAAAWSDGTVRFWRVADGACVRVLEGHPSGATSVDFSPDGTLLASGGADGAIRLWGVR